MKVYVALLALLFSTHIAANDQVAQKIDTAIEFANAGRRDIALQQFQRLLQTTLTPVEKASVLYNSAVILVASDRFWEGLLVLNQIDDDMFDKVVALSPVQAFQIAYNGALCSVGFARGKMLKLAQASAFSQKELDAISQALDSANHYIQKLDDLAQKKVIDPVSLSSFLGRTQLQEDIANISNRLGYYQQLLSLELLDKTALLEELGGLLQQQFYAVLNLYLAKNSDAATLGPYMQVYKEQEVGSLVFGFDRLLLYLQAPAKNEVVAMHAFFASEILPLQSELKEVFCIADLPKALRVLGQLSSMVLLIQAETANREVAALLDRRIEMAMQFLLAQDEPKRALVWQSQWQDMSQFSDRFLQKKTTLSGEVLGGFLRLVQKRLQQQAGSLPDVERAVDDAFYWKILSQAENTTYMDLASMLHGAQTIDVEPISKTVRALYDRVGVLQIDQALPPLTAMLKKDSPLLMFQDLIESWVYVDPEAAFSFMLGLLSGECNSLHLNPAADSFTARTDYHLLMHLLSLFLKNDDKGMLARVYNDLMQRGHWFTDKEKNELDFFTISLELGWLKEMLTGKVDNLEGITNAVDFGVDFQKKTMALLRYAQKAEFQPVLDLLSGMQEKLIHTVNEGLKQLKAKGPKIKQVIRLMADAEDKVKRQHKELASMQTVQDNLEQASKILHSMQAESKADSKNSKSSQTSAPSDADKPLEKQAVKLAPERSIRLLQQMEQEDNSLKTQNIPQVTGARPW